MTTSKSDPRLPSYIRGDVDRAPVDHRGDETKSDPRLPSYIRGDVDRAPE
jgi:hypothetical protein